jgi:hypothetical protein
LYSTFAAKFWDFLNDPFNRELTMRELTHLVPAVISGPNSEIPEDIPSGWRPPPKFGTFAEFAREPIVTVGNPQEIASALKRNEEQLAAIQADVQALIELSDKPRAKALLQHRRNLCQTRARLRVFPYFLPTLITYEMRLVDLSIKRGTFRISFQSLTNFKAQEPVFACVNFIKPQSACSTAAVSGPNYQFRDVIDLNYPPITTKDALNGLRQARPVWIIGAKSKKVLAEGVFSLLGLAKERECTQIIQLEGAEGGTLKIVLATRAAVCQQMTKVTRPVVLAVDVLFPPITPK